MMEYQYLQRVCDEKHASIWKRHGYFWIEIETPKIFMDFQFKIRQQPVKAKICGMLATPALSYLYILY